MSHSLFSLPSWIFLQSSENCEVTCTPLMTEKQINMLKKIRSLEEGKLGKLPPGSSALELQGREVASALGHVGCCLQSPRNAASETCHCGQEPKLSMECSSDTVGPPSQGCDTLFSATLDMSFVPASASLSHRASHPFRVCCMKTIV